MTAEQQRLDDDAGAREVTPLAPMQYSEPR